MDASAGSLAVPAKLEEVLKAIADKRHFKRPRFSTKAGSGNRDGYTSNVFRTVVAEVENPNKVLLQVISKISNSVMGGDLENEMFATEAYAFEAVLSALENVLHASKRAPWPRFLHGMVNGSPPHIVALEDLAPDGFAMADRSDTMDVAHVRLALLQLARLHAAGLALQQAEPDEYQRLVRPLKNGWDHPGMKANIAGFLKANVGVPDMIKDSFPEGGDVYERLKTLYVAFREDPVSLYPPGAGRGYTCIHNDCHVNNLMFQYDKVNGEVKGCRLIDFQLLYHGCPAVDLVTLLFVCTSKPLRDSHWSNLLREYFEELHDTLRTSGCDDPNRIYSWELFQEHLYAATPYGIGMAPLYFNGLYSDEETIKGFKEAMASDGKGDGFIVYKHTPAFKRHMVDLFTDVIAYGWLPSIEEITQYVAAHKSMKKNAST